MEPANKDLLEYVGHCQALRTQQQPTLPARLALERPINPFLRTREASIVAVARARDPAAMTDEQVFAVIRQWKNDFK